MPFVFLRLVGTLLNRQLHQLAVQAAYAQPQGNHKDDCKGNGQNNTVKKGIANRMGGRSGRHTNLFRQNIQKNAMLIDYVGGIDYTVRSL